jgi:SSS family solute:Na+ symporter
MNLKSLNKPVLEAFERAKTAPAGAAMVIPFDSDFAQLQPKLAAEVLTFNAAVLGKAAPAGDDVRALNTELLRGVKKSHPTVEVRQELVGYDYDGAFPLLIRYLTPSGLRGFVLAALMGAVISTLAAMLNAASTIFTMDIYREWFNKKAAQSALVWVGRCCVPVGVVIGCLIAPVLANPRFKGAFAFIQEFQGFVSPGVLTIFLFGLFVKQTPRYCGVLGLILSPIIYGILFFGWGDMAFLNRMGITVGAIAAILLIVTLAKPTKELITLPEQTKIELNWSKGSVYFGLFVTLLTVLLYIIFR